MTINSLNRSLRLLLSLLVLILPISGCRDGKPLVNPPPAAETPVLETILDIDNNLLAPFHPSGVFEMLQGRRLELRLRAQFPSTIRVMIENQTLPEVTDSAAHPELDASGYYRISETRPIQASDPRFFWRVLVVLPLDKRGNVNYVMSVHNISQDQNLTGTQKEAAPLQITVSRTPVLVPKPSEVVLSGPDAKHPNSGGDNAFIAEDVTLAGWLVTTPGRNPDGGTEDWHYDIWLDNDFIERNYSATSPPLAAAVMPGRWYTEADNIIEPKIRIPLTGGNQPNAGTFLIPGTDLFTVELNAWHPSKHNMQVPSGWVADPTPASFPDVFWPFPVMKPFGIGPNEPGLQEDDYVIITGALVQDSAHLHEQPPHTSHYWRSGCWDDKYKGQGGWLEIHPVDSIRRVPAGRAPAVRKHPQLIQVCDSTGGGGNTATAIDWHLTPIPSTPPSDYHVLRFREIIDDRFTDMSKVALHTIEVDPYAPAKLRVRVALAPNVYGRFKAVYLMWWEQGGTPRPTPLPTPQTPTPQGSTLLQDIPVCSKKPYLPQCNSPTVDR
jgi:hypothetical protein